MIRLAAVMAMAALAGAASPVSAQSAPDSENGRYTLSPASDGLVRLDTRTGTMSLCADKGAGWACATMPEERAAFDAEVGRLQGEVERLRRDNAALKAQLAALQKAPDKSQEAMPKADSLRPPESSGGEAERKLEIPLPSDRDVDRALAFFEQIWRKLVDMASRLQRDSGKI